MSDARSSFSFAAAVSTLPVRGRLVDQSVAYKTQTPLLPFVNTTCHLCQLWIGAADWRILWTKSKDD